jgi:hypothetical protein
MHRWLAFLAVSCDAAAPAARSPVQVVEVVPVRTAGHPAFPPERTTPRSAAHFPEACRAPESGETTAKASLPFGSLSVRIVHAAHSDDDVCVAVLADVGGSVTDCTTFADEGCDMEVPVASAGRITVEGVCISDRCGAAPQRSRRLFEVVAASARTIEVRAATGDVVQECAGE